MSTSVISELWNSNDDRPKMRLAVVILLGLVLLLVLRFCFGFVWWLVGSGDIRRYQVSGNVTVIGQPLDTGTITFFPTSDDCTAAIARISPEGTYETLMQAGKYKVVVDASQTTYRDYPDIEKGADSDKGLPELDFLVPDEYLDSKTTPLTIDVTASNSSENIAIPHQNKKTLLRQRLSEMTADASAKVFVDKSGKIIGPSSLKQVFAAIEDNKFTLDDKVSDSQEGPWLPILRSPLVLTENTKTK